MLVFFESCGDHVSDQGQSSVRDAFDAARMALGAMGAAAESPTGPSAVSVSAGATTASAGSDTLAQHDRAVRGWSAAERLLQLITAREDLFGQQVIAEARRQQRLSLNDAHALAALYSWADRPRAPSSGSTHGNMEAERSIASDALIALKSAAGNSGNTSGGDFSRPAPVQGASAYIESVAALGTPASGDSFVEGDSLPRADQASAPPGTVAAMRESRWNFDSRVVIGGIALLLVAALAIVAWISLSRSGSELLYADAVAAYQRGEYAPARVAFAQMAQENPDDIRPLIFLGRIAREEHDLARSKRFLEAAVQRDPQSGLAQRELAGSLLADGQAELARRFYVRAVELDPADRSAQGFLGCALHRLERYDEARRWFDRAGPGDWMQCITPVPAAGSR